MLTIGLVCGICAFIKALYIYLLATIFEQKMIYEGYKRILHFRL
jgi:hypothetical protein